MDAGGGGEEELEELREKREGIPAPPSPRRPVARLQVHISRTSGSPRPKLTNHKRSPSWAAPRASSWTDAR